MKVPFVEQADRSPTRGLKAVQLICAGLANDAGTEHGLVERHEYAQPFCLVACRELQRLAQICISITAHRVRCTLRARHDDSNARGVYNAMQVVSGILEGVRAVRNDNTVDLAGIPQTLALFSQTLPFWCSDGVARLLKYR